MRTQTQIPLPDKKPGISAADKFSEVMTLVMRDYFKAKHSENVKRGIARAKAARILEAKNEQ